MPGHQAIPAHHLSRRALRRQAFRRNIFLAVSSLLVLWSFGAGWLWQEWRAKRASAGTDLTPATADERREAMRLLDEAVRARHEERLQGAMNALNAARRADPKLGSIDILVGEIALEQKDTETLRHATDAALRSGEQEAPAKLLRALETWLKRGEKGVEWAGPQAKQYLAEASESEPSAAAPYFFGGELHRLLGDGAKAHRDLVSALHRQVPWRSSALLEAKMQLAAREAADEGKIVTIGPPDAQAEALLDFRQALVAGRGVAPDAADLFAVMPVLQLAALADDVALRDRPDAKKYLSVRGEAAEPYNQPRN